ncbi:putative G-protein coupled receptor 152 [Merluccius polli]|uniref:G-protein coupled receptor 152 n=1 Tax=Merluccius polli TaxID=89951 RepID=A0AA47P1Z7_MERPO|nr:putative G-protein coupled receptor 152 [Merluccius polli]
MAPGSVAKGPAGAPLLLILLVGLLLPSCLVSGASTPSSTSPSSTSPSSTSIASTIPSTTPQTSSSATANPTAQTSSNPTAQTSSNPTAQTSSNPTAQTSSNPTAQTSSSTTAQTSSSTTAQTNPTSSSATTPAAPGPNTTQTSSNSTGGDNMTTTATSMISCPILTCNYSDCYTMYSSSNSTMCPQPYTYCQMLRQTDMCYTVSCSASCMDMCTNTSQTNCSYDCCNTTDCLNATFAGMMMMTTTTPVPITTTALTTTTSIPTTTPDNRNKCHTGTCSDGADCYKSFTAKACTSAQKYCQLKKETVNSKVQWTAGCTANCSAETWCSSSTTTDCWQECCLNAQASCLALNGTMNVPSSAARGPRFPVDLMLLVLVCLLVVGGLHM